jgi:hypothetical protein
VHNLKDQDVLFNLGRERAATLFCSAEGAAFADVVISGHRRTWPLASDEFAGWLMEGFYLERKRAPSSSAVKSAIRSLGLTARFEGPRHEVYLRAAESSGRIYLDLGDTEFNAIEVGMTGWRVVGDAPVRFRRTPSMRSLPVPQPDGSINQLRRFVNLSDNDFVLFVAVLLDALRPGRPHPVLFLTGEEGSAKSTAATIARSLIDPNLIPLRTLPGTVRDLFIGVRNAHMLVWDNVSTITPEISDALCQISSGSGFATRLLYTDSAELLVGGSRPVVLNGLGNGITRSDLADRAVVLRLLPIQGEKRRTETDLWAEFESERSQIFGGLRDCAVYGLRELPNVHLQQPPRMADFALWSVACETAFAAPGAFLTAFEASATEATEAVVENDPVAIAIGTFMLERNYWHGTAAQLLHELTAHDTAEAQPTGWKTWPRDAASFGKALRRVAASMRKTGIEVSVGRATHRGRTRTIELRKIAQQVGPGQSPYQRRAAGAAR